MPKGMRRAILDLSPLAGCCECLLDTMDSLTFPMGIGMHKHPRRIGTMLCPVTGPIQKHSSGRPVYGDRTSLTALGVFCL